MNCDHKNITFTLTPELTHHGKEVCDDCGRFIRWVPKPESLERAKENARKLEVLKSKNLSEWEKSFVLSLEKQGRHYSPKQQLKLDELMERHA